MISIGGYPACFRCWTSSCWRAKAKLTRHSGATFTSWSNPGAAALIFKVTFSICFHTSVTSAPSHAELLADFETDLRSDTDSRRTEAQIQAELGQYKKSLERDTGDPAGRRTLSRNPFVGRDPLKLGGGMTTESVSTKISSAPMIWHCLGTSYQMELLAGFVGATQDELTLAIRPTIGWAVRQGWAEFLRRSRLRTMSSDVESWPPFNRPRPQHTATGRRRPRPTRRGSANLA